MRQRRCWDEIGRSGVLARNVARHVLATPLTPRGMRESRARHRHDDSVMPSDAAWSIERTIEEVVERAVERRLGPYLRRICEPEPAVYTVAQAAIVLQVSEDTIARLVRRGVLHRVPHVEGKVLIPRVAVDELLGGVGSEQRQTVATTPRTSAGFAQQLVHQDGGPRSEPGMKWR